MKPVVLVGVMPPPVNGQSVSFQLLVDELARRGVPHVVVDQAPRAPRPAIGNFSVRRLLELVPSWWRFARACVSRRGTAYVQIAQSRVGFLRDAAYVWTAAATRQRVVLHLHGGNYAGFYGSLGRAWRAFARATLHRADAVVVLSERLRADFAFDPAIAKRVRVVPNGIADPGPLPARAPLAGRPLRCLFISGMIRSKGYLEALEAIRVLVAERKLDVEADFCGQFIPEETSADLDEAARALEKDFRRAIDEGGLAGRVRVRGIVDNATKRELFRAADVLLLPTFYPHEGQPVVLLEAMAHGAVAVASDWRAIPDIVEDGATGRLVPARDARALAGALAALAARPEDLARMRAEARKRFEDRWTFARAADLLLDELAGAKREPAPAGANRERAGITEGPR